MYNYKQRRQRRLVCINESLGYLGRLKELNTQSQLQLWAWYLSVKVSS